MSSDYTARATEAASRAAKHDDNGDLYKAKEGYLIAIEFLKMARLQYGKDKAVTSLVKGIDEKIEEYLGLTRRWVWQCPDCDAEYDVEHDASSLPSRGSHASSSRCVCEFFCSSCLFAIDPINAPSPRLSPRRALVYVFWFVV